MKPSKPILLVGLAAGILSLQVALLAGPEGGASGDQTMPDGPGIALLDVPHVFSNHAGFKEEIEKMKADAEVEQAKLKAEGEQLEEMIERLKTLPRESKEAEESKKKITEIRQRLQTDVKRHQDSFRLLGSDRR